MNKPKSLHPKPKEEEIQVNIAFVILMSILFGFVLALIGFATVHYPSISGVI